MNKKRLIEEQLNFRPKISNTAFLHNETNLSKALKARKMSQRELAKRLEMKYTALNYACKNGIKTARVAERYAAVLCCDPAELMDFTPRPCAEKK